MKISYGFYKLIVALCLSLGIILPPVQAQTNRTSISRAENVFQVMKKVADWQWKTLEQDGWKTSKKDWTSGSMYSGMVAMASIANDETYYKKLIQVGEDNKWQVGKHREEADDYCVGQLYAQLYNVYKDPRFIADFQGLADSLVLLPHTESLEWKNKIDYREWAWCDALFMGPPALAYLTEATGDPKYLDKTSKLWWKTTNYLMDKEDYLFYRDSRFFTKKESNGAKVFWSRGNGWVMGGLVKVLSVMDKSHPDSAKFADLLKKMARKIADLQQPDGSWHASLLDPEAYPSKETSGTGFFCFALAWGINSGILSYNEFSPTVYKAWDAMISSVHPDGKLGFVQPQGASPDKVTYDDTDVYGVGAFLLAGKEMIYLDVNRDGKSAVLEVANKESKSRIQPVKISWDEVIRKNKKLNPKILKLADALTGEAIGFKLDRVGKSLKSISFDVPIEPGTVRILKLQND